MYKHITDVAPSLQHGDRVDVDGPYTYDEDVVFTASGNGGCAGAGTITINGIPDGAGVRPTIRGQSRGVSFKGNNYLFRNFDVTTLPSINPNDPTDPNGDARACIWLEADNITIEDTKIYGCPGHGINGADANTGSVTMTSVEVDGGGSGTGANAQFHQIYMSADEEKPGLENSVFLMQHMLCAWR